MSRNRIVFTSDFADTDAYRAAYVTGKGARYYAVIRTEDGREIAQFDGDAASLQYATETANTLNYDALAAAQPATVDATLVPDVETWHAVSAEVNGLGEPMPADADEALARQLYGEWLELQTLGADRYDPACDTKYTRIRALGYACVRRDGVWCLRCERSGAIVATPALFARAARCATCGSDGEPCPDCNPDPALDFAAALLDTAHLTTPASAHTLRSVTQTLDAVLRSGDAIAQELAAAALAQLGVRDEHGLTRLTQGDALSLDGYLRGVLLSVSDHSGASIDLGGLAEPVQRAA